MKPSLLVVELHHLGDAALSLPFVNAAAERFAVTVCCRPGSGAIYEMAIHPPAVMEWEPPWTGGRWQNLPELIRRLRRCHFHAAACVWADSRVHLLMKLTQAPQRVGLPMSAQNYYGTNIRWRRRQLQRGRMLGRAAQLMTGGRLLTDPILRQSDSQHHLESWQQVGRRLGVTVSGAPPWLRPGELPDNPALAGLLQRAHKNQQAVWLIHAGGRLATKRWPVERFKSVIERFFEPGNIPLIVVQAPGEPAPAASYPNAVTAAPNSVSSLAALVAHADRVLCNDSLVSHLAAGLGKPAVAIFGSGSPGWFAPAHAESRVVIEDVCPYHPCIDRCQMPSVVCLEAVTVEHVLEALNEEARRLQA